MTLWFRRRYNLPPTDPRYLSATLADIEADYWANVWQDRRDRGQPDEEHLEDDDFDLDAILEENAREAAGDPDAWEDVSDGPTD